MSSGSEPRVAVVTGAGGDLGRATCLRLGADGFAIGVVGKAGPSLDGTAAALADRGIPATTVRVDLADAEATRAAIAGIDTGFGPIEALINNAAIYPSGPFLEIPTSEYDQVIAVNQRAYFVAAQAAATAMASRGFGAIVNIGSITWHGALPGLASYVSTKGAAVGLTRALARELGPMGIRVNAVAPGAFPTKAEEIHEDPEGYSKWVIGNQAIKRRGSSDELAAVLSFLVGPDASFVTGQTLNVDGGWFMD
jgi:NAD(P)-dependent dehydrogenase (short-subunit alcohol dehydrogenase family)